jgi:hypothetical protein
MIHLILAIFVVHDDDHLALLYSAYRCFDVGKNGHRESLKGYSPADLSSGRVVK